MADELVYSRRREEYFVRSGAHLPDQFSLTQLEVPYALAASITVASVVAALRACVRHQGLPSYTADGRGNVLSTAATFNWGLPGMDLDPGDGIVQPGTLSVDLDLKPFFSVSLWAEVVDGDWDAEWLEFESVVKHWSIQRGLRLERLVALSTGDDFVWEVVFQVVRRGLTVGDLDTLVGDIEALAAAVRERQLSAENLLALVKDRHGTVLIGLAENAQLEAKRELQLNTTAAHIELAKDVASFANTGGSGLIVIGIATKKRRGYDELASIHHVDSRLTASLIRRSIDRNMFPRVEKLDVRRVRAGPTGQAEIVYIFVPPQPRPLLPFLVAGTVIERKTEAIYAGIPTRRDDETAMMSIQELHSVLRVGLALYEQDRPIRHVRRRGEDLTD